jgi:RNA polymerase sigma factor (sigma-70 family)
MPPTTVTSDRQDDLIDTYLRQWSFLRGILRRQTGSHELAEDTLQETWIRLSRMKGDSADIKDRQAFILRVAGNIAIDLVRKEQRHSSRCISDEALVNAVADASPSPETVVIDRDRLRTLVKALAQLPAKPRSALLMNRCDGFTHAMIAQRLKVSESMVARYLVQALRHCRDHFSDGM